MLSSALDVSSEALICEVALALVTALNFLFGVGWSNNPVILETFAPLSPAQFAVLEHLFTSARRYLSSEEVPYDAPAERSLLVERKLSYSGELVSVRRELVADKVIACWPKVDEAANCPIVDFILTSIWSTISPIRCVVFCLNVTGLRKSPGPKFMQAMPNGIRFAKPPLLEICFVSVVRIKFSAPNAALQSLLELWEWTRSRTLAAFP